MTVRPLYTQTAVRRLLSATGLTPHSARVGSAIALCEAPCLVEGGHGSDFGAIGDQALADDVWGFSYGGFQIRSLRAQKGTGGFRDEDRLTNPAFNARSAAEIRRTSGWWAWSTYSSGMYKAYLQDLYPPPPGVYVVLGGDTLSGIANGSDYTWQDLARVNNLHDPYPIYIGQQLKIPTVGQLSATHPSLRETR